MMNYKLFLFALALLLMSNCKTQTQNSDHTVTIGINKKASIPNSKINIEFVNVAEDSRCPVGVTCVWEGIAIVDMKATNGNEVRQFQLATKDFEPKNTNKTFSYSGYNITLQAVKPYPGGKDEAASVTIKYEKEK